MHRNLAQGAPLVPHAIFTCGGRARSAHICSRGHGETTSASINACWFPPWLHKASPQVIAICWYGGNPQLAARRAHAPKAVNALRTCHNLAIPQSASRHGQRVSYFEPTPSRLKENIHTFASRGNAWRKLCWHSKPVLGIELRTLTSQDRRTTTAVRRRCGLHRRLTKSLFIFARAELWQLLRNIRLMQAAFCSNSMGKVGRHAPRIEERKEALAFRPCDRLLTQPLFAKRLKIQRLYWCRRSQVQ